MKRKKIIYRFILGIVAVTSISLSSCSDDFGEEFVLTGNIENLIPDYSYNLTSIKSSDDKYVLYTPNLNEKFDYWGLSLKQVDYYLDGNFYANEKNAPFSTSFSAYDVENEVSHTIEAYMTIVGEECDDAIIKDTKEFTLSPHNHWNGDFFVDYNYFTKGDDLVITVELMSGDSTEGCEIDYVQYFVNGEYVGNYTEAPYTFRYHITEDEGSTFSFQVGVYYHDNSGTQSPYYLSVMSKVYTSEDNILSWKIKQRSSEYTQKDVLQLVARGYEGINSPESLGIDFYLDDVLIGSSTSFPYSLDYKLSSCSYGLHVIKGQNFYIDKETSKTTSTWSEELIMILE